MGLFLIILYIGMGKMSRVFVKDFLDFLERLLFYNAIRYICGTPNGNVINLLSVDALCVL